MAPRRSFAQVGGALLALGLLAPALASTAEAAPKQPDGSRLSIEPRIDANFPDPDILLADGVYHAYATNTGGQNVQHQTSTNLKDWTPQPDAAPVLGDWVGPCSFSPGGATDQCVWAPEVAAVEGGYALYYTARDEASQRQCIGVSLSDSPDGPFVPVGDDPLVCPTHVNGPDLGGAIDAGTFYEDGQLWLLWKGDGNCCAKPAIIYIQPMSADGTELTGPATELIRNDRPWEGAVVEAPTMLEHEGTYYLFYSANDFFGGNYRTGYATSSSPTGPFTKADTELLTSDMFQGDVRGPGGQDIVTRRDGTMSIVFHGWNPDFTYRAMYTSPFSFDADGTPVVGEAVTRYQAEDGVVINARVVGDGSASGGEKVGGLDFADSSVEVQVWRDAAGPATLGIRYANGSAPGGQPSLSTHRLTVNGADEGLLTFLHTTWGNWQLVEARVDLQAGWNSVELTRDTLFAEIDSIDVYEHLPNPVQTVHPTNRAGGQRFEAESGVVTNARVVGDAGASGGAKVGGLDFADSSVSFQVYAAKTDRFTLGVRFANGSERGGYLLPAVDRLSINGKDEGLISMPHTRWGNWSTIEQEIRLRKGWNTVTLTRVAFYAEIDAIDIFPQG